MQTWFAAHQTGPVRTSGRESFRWDEAAIYTGLWFSADVSDVVRTQQTGFPRAFVRTILAAFQRADRTIQRTDNQI
jgi:hypothetical protein